MCIKVIQGTISLLAAVPSALVHSLDFLISSSGSLVLLGAGNGDERVNLCQMMLLIISSSPKSDERKTIRDALQHKENQASS